MKDKIFKEVADRLGYDEGLVKDVFMSTFEFIKDRVEELPLKSDMTEEEFSRLKTSFSLSKLGKFGCDYQTYKRERNKFKKIEEYAKSKNIKC